MLYKQSKQTWIIQNWNNPLLKNISWLTLISGFERIVAVFQTVLVARALGMTEYGVYGLMFGTIGLASSIAGMQLGLTATVFVARYRESDRSKAAFVIRFVNRFAIAVAALFILTTVPFAAGIAEWLIGPVGSKIVVIAGCFVVASSIMSGVQDGVIQGFEDFRSLALARLASTIIALVLVYPAGVVFGLSGVMATVLLGILAKYLFLEGTRRRYQNKEGFHSVGDGVLGWNLMWGFSVPSMLVSLLTGVIGWSGIFVLSRQLHGFDAIAVVNTGMQWRGPILLLASIASTVAVPAISRYYQQKDHAAIYNINRLLLIFNAGLALVTSAVLILLSPFILFLYGPSFVDGAFIFSLVVVSSIPQAIAGVYLQQLVAKAQMWQQLILHLWLVVPLGFGYAVTIPTFGGLGLTVTHLIAWSIFAVALAIKLRGTLQWSLSSKMGLRSVSKRFASQLKLYLSSCRL